jgi:hypothetical protein
MEPFSHFYENNKYSRILNEGAKQELNRNRANGDLTGIIIYLPASGSRDGFAAILETFPGSAAIGGSWRAAQESMRCDMIEEGWKSGLPYPIEM